MEVLVLLVFPTHVGMARTATSLPRMAGRVPHTRGDGPKKEKINQLIAECSPHTWGWPVLFILGSYKHHVFPTHVGMARSC